MIFTLIILVLTVPINGCMFKKKEIPAQNKLNPGIWNDINHDRSIEDGCECGEHIHNETGDRRWNLFISHSKMDDRGNKFIDPVCVASIITSNLVATVLKCVLTTDDVTLNVYHAWLPDTYSEGLVNKSNIIVSTMSGGEGEQFPVEEIIFGTKTIYHLLINNHKLDFNIHNDLLLLKVEVSGREFLGNSRLRPICIPRINSLDFSSRLGTYYGIGSGQHLGTFNSDYHYGIIDSKRVCDNKEMERENSTEQFESLCLKWRISKEMPSKTFRGGPLFFESVQNGAAFLAGVEYQTELKPLDGKEYMFAYFTNILPMIKYIEHRAIQSNSTSCRTKSLALPEKVLGGNHKSDEIDIPFEPTEIPPEVSEGSWWCVEHQDIINNKTETDWERFAEGANILKEEICKCNKKDTEADTIYFYQKGNPEPFGKEAVSNSYRARREWTCQNFTKEWVAKTDYVSATTCVVLLKECDSDVEFDWYYGNRDYPEGNKVPRVVVNEGEKINVEWFGLAKQVKVFRRCRELHFDYQPPVVFYVNSGEVKDYYWRENMCACNNLNSSFGLPSQVINERECLEMYENENCTGWIRTVPPGRNIHTQNLSFKGSVKLPQIKSFSRCFAKPNCYELDVSFFKVVLKNQGVTNWNIWYQEYDTIKETVSHDSAEGNTTFVVKRDHSVITGALKVLLFKGITSLPNNGPYFELEDKSSAGIPHTSADTMSRYFRTAYENYIHKQSAEAEEHVGTFWVVRPNKFITGHIGGFGSATFHEWFHKADNVEFNYYALILIHGMMASGQTLSGDLLREKIAKDLGYDKTEKCDSHGAGCNQDGEWVRLDGKFWITVSDGKTEQNPLGCSSDRDKCKSECNDTCCTCSISDGICYIC